MSKITIELASKAALVIARGKWGECTVSKGIPVYDIDSDNINAYLFRVALGNSVDINKSEQLFDSVSKAIRQNPGLLPGRFLTDSSDTRQFKLYEAAKAKMLSADQVGTVIIAADEGEHPLVMAYSGISFDLVGSAMIKEINGTQFMAGHDVKIRQAKGIGHFFGEFKQQDSSIELVSLFDAVTTYKQAKAQTMRIQPRVQAGKLKEINHLTPAEQTLIDKDIKARKDRISKLWSSLKKIDNEHVKTINPAYFAATKSGSTAGSTGSNQHYISGVPDLQWHGGCAPTAAGNILAYWDVHGYPRLVDDPVHTAYDMVDELVSAMGTNSNGDTYDDKVDDGIRHVCNAVNLYRFSTDGPDSWYVWGKIKDEINAGRPAHIMLHGHSYYGEHSVTLVGYRNVDKDCAPDDHYITIHDNWTSTPMDIEIPYEGSVNAYDGDWRIVRVIPGGASNKQVLNDTSVSAPGSCTFAGRLNVAWSGRDDNHRLNNIASPGDGVWEQKVTLNDTSPNGVSLCEFNGRLYMAWSGTGNRRINIISSNDGINWTNKVTMSDTSIARPMLAVHNGILFLAWTGTDSRQHLNIVFSTNGTDWTGKRTLDDAAISAPALGSMNGRLYIAWTGTNSSHNLNVMSTVNNGVNWQNKVTLGDTSITGPSLLAINSVLYLAWAGRDDSHHINTIQSTNGTLFSNKQTFGDSSDSTPQLAVYQGLPCVVWTGRDSAQHLNVMMI